MGKEGVREEATEAVEETERKIKGVYYTPDTVTGYICNTTIRPYLAHALEKKDVDINELVRGGAPEDLRTVGMALESVKVLDPACGSGAFLIKAADMLFQLRSTVAAKLGDAPDHYGIKLDIIRNNIFGVEHTGRRDGNRQAQALALANFVLLRCDQSYPFA